MKRSAEAIASLILDSANYSTNLHLFFGEIMYECHIEELLLFYY